MSDQQRIASLEAAVIELLERLQAVERQLQQTRHERRAA